MRVTTGISPWRRSQGKWSNGGIVTGPHTVPVTNKQRTLNADKTTLQDWPAGGDSALLTHFLCIYCPGFSSIMYSELRRITANFNDRSISDGGSRLGEGGFGTVYKGFLNNRPVAVKKLNPVSQSIYIHEITLSQMLKLTENIMFPSDGWNASE